ncbi:MAG: aspartate carbamoyltransferase regulatory subunit [Candidatus Altiarchaeota archaeon]|nr:aspartate carbamoyltransferase regulatory subunit [Candidatus Altiarchaeota archaeon]
MEKTLKVQKIRGGTVIDHIASGHAWDVVKILGLETYPETVMVLSNITSKRLGKKDIIKVENKELKKNEVNMVSLLSPSASVNIIKNFEIKEKYNVDVPKEVIGLLKCTNPVCITHEEPVKSKFFVESEEPLTLRCAYCERILNKINFI